MTSQHGEDRPTSPVTPQHGDDRPTSLVTSRYGKNESTSPEYCIEPKTSVEGIVCISSEVASFTEDFSGCFSLRSICHELGEVAYKWFSIGIQLSVPRHKLMEFKKDDDPLAAAIDYWLNGNVEGVSISWSSIVTALKSSHVGEIGLANKIKKKYCLEDEGSYNLCIGSYT